jgi:hypothetical protein
MNPINLIVCVATALCLAGTVTASPDTSSNPHDLFNNDHAAPDAHLLKEQRTVRRRLATLRDGEIYSCQLMSFSHQCREYPMLKAEPDKLAALKASCESLPNAQLVKAHCPQANQLAQCQNIVRNHHDPKTLVYNNIYYSGPNSPWNTQDVQRICADMEGRMVSLPTP